jgi:hypothetical protein
MNQDDPGSDFTENGTARYDQEHTQTTSESGRRTSADADPPEKPNIFRQVQTAQFLFWVLFGFYRLFTLFNFLLFFLVQVAASSFMITYGLWAGFIMGYNAVGIPSFCRDDQRPFDMTIHSRSLFGKLHLVPEDPKRLIFLLAVITTCEDFLHDNSLQPEYSRTHVSSHFNHL